MTRADRLRAIIGHLDALIDDLNGDVKQCGDCGLKKAENWSEANAKNVLKESRKKYERMIGQDWVAKKGEER